MKVGIPREVKNHEYRVAITPAGVHELVRNGHEVFVEEDAGVGSSIPDDDLRRGRRADPADRRRRLGRRRPDPQGQGADRARSTTGCARARSSSPTCTWPPTGRAPRRWSSARSPASPTRPSSCPTGRCRCWRPMSEVAGRLAPQVGAHTLMRAQRRPGRAHGRRLRRLRREGRRHRRGRLRPERRRDRAGHAGRGAAARPQRRPAARRPTRSTRATARRWRRTRTRSSGRSSTPTSSSAPSSCRARRRPKLITNELVSRMKPGSVLVDISIDQGGCFEDSRPTTHADPTYQVHDSVFYCVANMPGAVPHTSHLRADQRDPAVRGRAGQPGLAPRAAGRPRRWRWASTPTTARSRTGRSPRRTACRALASCWPTVLS